VQHLRNALNRHQQRLWRMIQTLPVSQSRCLETPPHSQTVRFSITRVSATRVCVSLERLLISPLVTAVSQVLCPGIGSQVQYPLEHRRPQPDLRVPTPPRGEQPCDSIPRRLKQQYEFPPSRLPEEGQGNFRGLVWDLGRRLLDFVGSREESPQREWRPIPYLLRL